MRESEAPSGWRPSSPGAAATCLSCTKDPSQSADTLAAGMPIISAWTSRSAVRANASPAPRPLRRFRWSGASTPHERHRPLVRQWRQTRQGIRDLAVRVFTRAPSSAEPATNRTRTGEGLDHIQVSACVSPTAPPRTDDPRTSAGSRRSTEPGPTGNLTSHQTSSMRSTSAQIWRPAPPPRTSPPDAKSSGSPGRNKCLDSASRSPALLAGRQI